MYICELSKSKIICIAFIKDRIWLNPPSIYLTLLLQRKENMIWITGVKLFKTNRKMVGGHFFPEREGITTLRIHQC